MKWTIEKINKIKIWFFEEITTDESLANLIKRKIEKTQITNIRTGKVTNTTKNHNIENIIKE